MNMYRSVSLSLAGAVALALAGTASAAAGETPQQTQTSPPPPTAPMRAQPPMPLPPPPPPPPRPAQPPMPTPPPAPPTPAQPPMPLPPPPRPAQPPMPLPGQQQARSGRFYPGTQSSATYQIQHGTLTVNAGMPAHVQNYGPPPPFKTLDANHNGRISESEAQAYPPLDSDFLYASGGVKSISRARYNHWVKLQH